jgi:hypothetical protein
VSLPRRDLPGPSHALKTWGPCPATPRLALPCLASPCFAAPCQATLCLEGSKVAVVRPQCQDLRCKILLRTPGILSRVFVSARDTDKEHTS